MKTVTFLPWLRAGLAQHIVCPAPGCPTDGIPTQRQAALQPYLVVNSDPVAGLPSLVLRGPGDVTGLHPGAIVRVDPSPGSTVFESSYLPAIEFSAPDLPWLFTPASVPVEQNRLMPWLVLVVVEVREGVSLGSMPEATVPVLTIGSPALPSEELPDLTEAWAWAHVHSDVGGVKQTIEENLSDPTRPVIARLLGARRLSAGKTYLACVVPAFDVGREVALGRDLPGSALGFAWDLTPDPATGTIPADTTGVQLPVYYSWSFSTGPGGDFQSLALRLGPTEQPARLGLHEMDVSKPGGPIEDFDQEYAVDFAGLLSATDSTPTEWPTTHRDGFVAAMQAWFDAAQGRVRLDSMPTEDVLVAPPMYGQWQASVHELPANGWMNELNLDPTHRVVAGLGAAIVRQHQETLMAAAWDQAGQARAAQVEVNQAALQGEVVQRIANRVKEFDEGTLLQLSQPYHAMIPGENGNAALSQVIAESRVPDGLLDQAFVRRTRQSTKASMLWRERGGGAASILRHVTSRFVGATGPAPTVGEEVLDFSRYGAPMGTFVDNPNATLPSLPNPDVTAAANVVKGQLADAKRWVRASVARRVSTFDSAAPADRPLPSRVPLGTQESGPVGPTFEIPLYCDLQEMATDLLLPGVRDIPDDSIRILGVNTSFVAALLVGANHEMSREYLFREFPADLSVTSFQYFWESMPGQLLIPDIDPIDQWPLTTPLAEVLSNGTTSITAVLIKGELVRRYPGLVVYIVPATDTHPFYDMDGAIAPRFFGDCGPGIRFFGFDKSESQLRSGGGEPLGYWVVLEEPATSTRFKVNTVQGSILPASSGDSASVAAALFDNPFRLLRHADQLLPDPT